MAHQQCQNPVARPGKPPRNIAGELIKPRTARRNLELRLHHAPASLFQKYANPDRSTGLII
jgi:hypothetical protein